MAFDPQTWGPDLSAYLDGELTPRRRREIEDALAASPELRALLADLRLVVRDIRALPRVAAPEALAERLASFTAAARSSQPRLHPASRGVQTWLRLRGVLSSAALVALGVWMGRISVERGGGATRELLSTGRDSAAIERARGVAGESVESLDDALADQPALPAHAPRSAPGERPTSADDHFATADDRAADRSDPSRLEHGLSDAARDGAARRWDAQRGVASPELNVVVVPNDESTLQDVFRVLSTISATQWQRDAGPVAKVAKADSTHASNVRYESAYELPPPQAADFLNQLQLQAPNQVYVDPRSSPHVLALSQQVTPSQAEYAMPGAEPGAPDPVVGGRGGGGGTAANMRQSPETRASGRGAIASGARAINEAAPVAAPPADEVRLDETREREVGAVRESDVIFSADEMSHVPGGSAWYGKRAVDFANQTAELLLRYAQSQRPLRMQIRVISPPEAPASAPASP